MKNKSEINKYQYVFWEIFGRAARISGIRFLASSISEVRH